MEYVGNVVYVSSEEFNSAGLLKRFLREAGELLSRPFDPQAFRIFILRHKEIYAGSPEKSEYEASKRTDYELYQQYNTLKEEL